MNNKNYVRHLYDELENIPKEIKELKLKVLDDKITTLEEFESLKNLIRLKESWLTEAIGQGLTQLNILKQIRTNPEEADIIKGNISEKGWDVFKNNLADFEWLPARGEICDTCGRTTTSTTAVAIAIVPVSKQLEIICSRCLSERLPKIKITGDMLKK